MSDLNVNVDEIKDPEVVPPGVYPAIIHKLDYALVDRDGPDIEENHKRDKNGNRYLSGEFVISGGEWDGRHVFRNYLDPNSTTFRDLCFSCGKHGIIGSTKELVGLQVNGLKVDNELYNDKLRATVEGFV